MLEEKRKDAKLTQAELADLLEVAQQTVAKWESGERTPRTKMAIRIIEVLRSRKVKATIQELFG